MGKGKTFTFFSSSYSSLLVCRNDFLWGNNTRPSIKPSIVLAVRVMYAWFCAVSFMSMQYMCDGMMDLQTRYMIWWLNCKGHSQPINSLTTAPRVSLPLSQFHSIEGISSVDSYHKYKFSYMFIHTHPHTKIWKIKWRFTNNTLDFLHISRIVIRRQISNYSPHHRENILLRVPLFVGLLAKLAALPPTESSRGGIVFRGRAPGRPLLISVENGESLLSACWRQFTLYWSWSLF